MAYRPVLESRETYARTRALNARLQERNDRLSPGTAGALTGAAAGVAGFWLIEGLHALDLMSATPSFMSAFEGSALADLAPIVGSAGAALAGAIVGALFAVVTRHVRRWGLLLVWSLIFFPVFWLALYAFLLRGVPAVQRLGFAPTILACLAFALLVTLELPIRRRRGRLELVEDDELVSRR